MSYNVVSTLHASKDLDEIITYIAKELENPTAAAAVLDEVSACYAELETMPYVYMKSAEIPGLRH